MNRLIRIILYITAGCAGIGCAALILSFVLGGRFDDDDDVLHRMKNTARGIAAEIRDDFTDDDAYDDDDMYDDDDAYDDDMDFDSYDSSGEMEGMLSADASGVRVMDIDLRHASLSISRSKDNCIRVELLSGTAGSITAKCENGEVIIKDSRKGKESRRDAEIELQIPKNMQFETFRLQADAGVVESDCPFAADQLAVNVDAGEIELSGVSAERFTSTVGAGCVDIEDASFGSMELDCGVGTMDIEASASGDSKISCGMGAIDIDLKNGADSVNYILSCGMGYIEIGDNSYSALSKEKRIDNGAQAAFTVNCGMGAVCID